MQLNYALTLEHLEDTFYKEGIANYSESDFAAAGFDATFYQNLLEVSADEATHVAFITAGLTAAGATPVAACTYDFPSTDAASFVALASVLEGMVCQAHRRCSNTNYVIRRWCLRLPWCCRRHHERHIPYGRWLHLDR